METKRTKKLNLSRFIPVSLLFVLLAVAVVLLIAVLSQGPEYRPQTDAEIAAILELNEARGLSAEQEQLVTCATSLVGKVHYFWGGKSSAVGWDDRWGSPMEVKSEGSDTTGTVRPFGLDCSGFVSWCFMQTGMTPEDAEEIIGNGTYNQWNRSAEIEWKELQVGDIVFIRTYPTGEGNHIGLCIGFDEKGEPYFAHCSATYDNVVVTPAGEHFRYARRVAIFG